MKKVLLVLVAVIIGISLNTQAEDFSAVYNGDTIYYNITSTNLPRTVEVTYKGTDYMDNEYLSAISIPDSVQYNGNYFKVISIGERAFSFSGITSIIIPKSVTSIDGSAFSFSGITSIIIPNSVTSIGGSAFYFSELNSITIPNSVTSIGGGAFENTPYYNNMPDGLIYFNKVLYKYKGTMPTNTSISIQAGTISISGGAFSGCTGLISITIPNSVNLIDGSTFSGCTGLTSITIPNTVISIGGGAFENCSGLTSILIPNSVTSIGNWAFKNCSGLTSIIIPNSVNFIGWGAFENTPYYNNMPDGLIYINNVLYQYKGIMPVNTSISIQAGTINISPHAFGNCSGLTSIIIPNSVTSIGNSAFFGCSGLTSITIPNSVTSIGNSVFYNCSGLTSITIPNSVTFIGSGAFFGCSGLTSITIPNSVTSIDEGAFQNCSGLTSITIPNTVTSIGHYTFYGCCELTSINIPNSVNYIGEYAFYDCIGLDSIICEAINPPVIGNYTFENVDNTTPIYVPCGSLSLYQGAQYWSEFTNYKCLVGLGEEIETKVLSKIYPNPTSDKAVLEFEGLNDYANVSVIDLFGKVIKEYKINKQDSNIEIDVRGFAKGVYNVVLQNDKMNIYNKLIVQ